MGSSPIFLGCGYGVMGTADAFCIFVELGGESLQVCLKVIESYIILGTSEFIQVMAQSDFLDAAVVYVFVTCFNGMGMNPTQSYVKCRGRIQ